MSANEDQNKTYPYQSLGRRLKRLRERRLESLAEVSGAVEIDTMQLEAIETGKRLPSEDILLLLINHFSIKDADAAKLWELAGYAQPDNDQAPQPVQDDPMLKQTLIVMPVDNRIVYTDTVHVVVNNYGVIMNFLQGGGASAQPLSIARVGMSKEHAKSVLELLQRTLAQSEPKSLPSKSTQQKTKNNPDTI